MKHTEVRTNAPHEGERDSDSRDDACAPSAVPRIASAPNENAWDVTALIRGYASVLRGAAGDTVDIEFVCDDGGARHDVDVDPTQFKAAMLNLVDNAHEAMPEGGRVVVSSALVDIGGYDTTRPRLPPGRYVAVTVSDSGAGFAADALEHAFEPFYTSKEAAPPGIGLGLCQVSGFAMKSDGGIGIVTELGKGTSVTIYLPLKSRIDDAVDGGHGVAGSTKTILLVEDDEHVRRSTFHAIELLGYRVIEATNGPDALARLGADGAIDILFTDVVMPHGMSGVMLAREARALRPDLGIVLASGHPREAIGAAQLDEFAFLPKPYRLQDLAAALQGIVASPSGTSR